MVEKRVVFTIFRVDFFVQMNAFSDDAGCDFEVNLIESFRFVSHQFIVLDEVNSALREVKNVT